MVGGFSESKYLGKTLREMYQPKGVQIVNVDDATYVGNRRASDFRSRNQVARLPLRGQ